MLDFTQSKLNFELSFVEVHQVLREIWFFNRNVKQEILANFEFLGHQICQQTVHRITRFRLHFQLKSKRESKSSYFIFSKKLIQISQILVTQAMQPLQSS